MSKFFSNLLIIIALIISLGLFGLVGWTLGRGIFWYRDTLAERQLNEARNQAIDEVINSHRVMKNEGESQVDPFGDDGIVNILFLGLDKRAGQTAGHCDAIQLITIDNSKQSVVITAVPRGTYSPLPPGTGTTSTDYYVSNACGLGGLEYGIKQIEKILGKQADYLVVVGFSETLGILRNLKLPTVDTLQWLRQRHVYAIGEPQRARDHSTFLKYLMVNFVPKTNSQIDKTLQYIIYKTVSTDLSFDQTQILVESLAKLDLTNHPERIQLAMRPAYSVQDIQYVPENLAEYLDKMITPIKNSLSKDDYADVTTAETQARLLELIENKKSDSDFIIWAFNNDFWLQIEDNDQRLTIQFDILERYLPFVSTTAERQSTISDYILEMENYGETEWVEKGRELLAKEIGQ